MTSFQLPEKIGIDFDNTLIDYSNVIHYYAVELGFVDPGTTKDKNEIRNKVRLLDDGENKWQKLQALIYGIKISKAQIFKDVINFFQHCLMKNITIHIVSHKTIFASKDETRTNLREAALNWMYNNSFFKYVSKENVFFESTREKKIARIAQLGCQVFIDDLEEIFLEKRFPNNIRKILFNPNMKIRNKLKIETALSWKEVFQLVFK